MKLDAARRPIVAYDYLGSQMRYNDLHIGKHWNSPVHQAVIKSLQEERLKIIPEEFENIQKAYNKQSQGIYEATANMFRLVYVEAMANIAPDNHNYMVDVFKYFGINIGTIADSNNAATLITKAISKQMHHQFIEFLKKSEIPFSIILDTSTDASTNHYLIVYLQILEEHRPIVMFYRLIELTDDETGKGLFTSLLNKIQEDGLEDKFKTNLAGYASDGASVTAGQQKGLIAVLKDYFKLNIFAVHCMSHRLHLVTGKALDKKAFFNEFEKDINSIYSFYNLYAHKHKAHLRRIASEMGEALYTISYIYKVRWISSELTAMIRLQKSWKILAIDLKEISADTKSFNLNTRMKADEILKFLCGKNFMILLHYFMDLMHIFSYYSKIFQTKDGLLIGKEDMRLNILKSLEQIKSKDGS